MSKKNQNVPKTESRQLMAGDLEILELRALATAAEALIGRGKLANVAGKTFGGNRDIYETCGYTREISPIQYRSRYRRNAVAKRVVECFPIDTWRGGFELVEDQELDKNTKFEKAWAALAKKLKLNVKFKQADILSRIGRYSIIVIGAPGKLEEPLVKAGPTAIQYISLYAEEDAAISEYDNDEKSPRFGLPVFYDLKRNVTNAGSSAKVAVVGKRVHYTRVQHVAEGLLEDTVFGTPALECVWNLLDDLEKITGGGAESFWLRANQGMHVDIDPTMNPSQPELDAMRESIEKYRHKLERVLRTRGAKINMLGSDVADMKGPQSGIVEQISAGTGIPTRVLMGSEQGKLAAEQDSVKYYRMCEGRRVEHAEEIVRQFVDWMVRLGVLPAPKQNEGEYEVRWSEIRTKDDQEKAALAAQWASLNQGGKTVVTENEIREHCLDLEPLEDVEGDVSADEQALEDALVKGGPELDKKILRALSGSPELDVKAPEVHVHVVKSGKKRVLRDEHGALIGVEDVD